jgi:hypothetical protein
MSMSAYHDVKPASPNGWTPDGKAGLVEGSVGPSTTKNTEIGSISQGKERTWRPSKAEMAKRRRDFLNTLDVMLPKILREAFAKALAEHLILAHVPECEIRRMSRLMRGELRGALRLMERF